jgi:hypothetical protein
VIRNRLVPLMGRGAVVVTLLGGCGAIDDLPNVPQLPVVVPFEVWNRTEEAVFLLDADGRRLDVPACAGAAVDAFKVNRVDVRTDRGYVFAFGSAGDGPLASRPQFLVVVAADGQSFPESERPVELPPCRGRPNAQPGV